MKIILTMILGVTFALTASFVPIDRAKKVAENQYNQYCAAAGTKGAAIVNVIENLYEGEITWYAFEFEKGFVIVSADDAVRPVLGYSDHGSVPKSDKPGGENFKAWFRNNDKQIVYARKNRLIDKTGREVWKKIENNEFSSSKAGIKVDRLVQSKWDQCWPWNAKCPVVNGVQSFTGCAATAAAQILRYHQYPSSGEGFNEVDFSTHSWNYSKMPDEYIYDYGIFPEYWEGSEYDQEIVDELALFNYWVGLSLDIEYNVDGYGSSQIPDIRNAQTAFMNNWKALNSVYGTYYAPPPGTPDPDYETIKSELDNKRPWLWHGEGHVFILDGYTDDYWYHFNWGWGGAYDGWYDRRVLIVPGTGGGGTDPVDFTNFQQGITFVPQANPFDSQAATTVTGYVSDGEDVTINWSAMSGASGYNIYRTADMNAFPQLLCTTSLLSYSDNDLSAGEYSYFVIVLYPSGQSHNSNVYGCVIAPVGDYLPPTGLTGTASGRSSIGLDWIKPAGIMVPEGYEVFRNGISAAMITGADNVAWTDYGFSDGENFYYVRTLYPSSNFSIPTPSVTVRIDADPNPGYLSGKFDQLNSDIDLEWYQPYMKPPIWYSYYDIATSTTTIDKVWDAAPKRRVIFGSELGYNYPVTIDSIGAYFYERSDKPWSTDRFAIRIIALGNESLPDTVLWEALNQTAVSGEFYKIKLPVSIVRTKGWAVEIEAEGTTTGDPGNLAGPTPDGKVHSFFYNTLNSSYDSYMLTAGVPAEYAILSFVESAEEPPIEKALISYNVYRNTVFIGNTSNKYFTDADPTSDNDYYVTAVYDNPAGESGISNVINVSPPAEINVPVSINESVVPGTSATRSFSIANSGSGVLDYEVSFEYIEPLSEQFTPVDNDFAAGLSGFVDGGTGTAWAVVTDIYSLDKTPYANCYATSNNTNTVRTLTTPLFDGTYCEYLSFDHVSIVSTSGSSFKAEYSIDGGSNYLQLYSVSVNTGGWGYPDHQKIALPAVSASMKIRFTATLVKKSGNEISLDNVLVYGTNVVLDPWFSLLSPVSGSVAAASNFNFNCGYDASALAQDSVYHANITVSSNDPNTPSVVIPVTLTVTSSELEAPANIQTSILGSDLVITWSAVSGATSYNIYSSNEPYGTFTLDTAGTLSGVQYTVPASVSKKFYYIKAANTAKKDRSITVSPNKTGR